MAIPIAFYGNSFNFWLLYKVVTRHRIALLLHFASKSSSAKKANRDAQVTGVTSNRGDREKSATK